MNRIRSEVGHLNPTEFLGVGIDGVRAEVSVAASVRPRWMTITVATALLAGASPVRGLTLEAALTHVARTNPSLQAARDGARSSHEGVPLALSAWLPTIQASGSHAWTDRDSRSPVKGHQETRSAELSYSHNLYRGGVDRAALRRAEAEVARSHAMVDDTEQTLLLRATAAYLDVIRAKRTVTLRETALAAFEARAGETKTRRAAAPERGWVRRPMRAHGARTSCSPRSARRRNRQRPPGMNCTRPDNDTRLFRPEWRHHAWRSTEFVARPKSASARHESSWTPNGTWCRAR